ncbi:hypothetical protein PENSPDRAFT_694071 [Peniophora sp. CONT]|nr:hypothetical protein PENSPDRAFT_694071 [Peniophora sp. CONT]
MSTRNARPRMVDQPSARLETKYSRMTWKSETEDDPLLSWMHFVHLQLDSHPTTPIARYFEPELLCKVGLNPDSPLVQAVTRQVTSKSRMSVAPTITRASGQLAQPAVAVHLSSLTPALQSPQPHAATVEPPLSPDVPVLADSPSPE